MQICDNFLLREGFGSLLELDRVEGLFVFCTSISLSTEEAVDSKPISELSMKIGSGLESTTWDSGSILDGSELDGSSLCSPIILV